MANPFLVLGGVAVGVITAGIGVLSVPGWIDSAHDSAAMNDLGNIRGAESAAILQLGEYTDDFAVLESGELGVKFQKSDTVTLIGLKADSNESWCASALSKSGKFFAASSDTARFATGSGARTAMTAVGCDPDLVQEIIDEANNGTGPGGPGVNIGDDTATDGHYVGENPNAGGGNGGDGNNGPSVPPAPLGAVSPIGQPWGVAHTSHAVYTINTSNEILRSGDDGHAHAVTITGAAAGKTFWRTNRIDADGADNLYVMTDGGMPGDRLYRIAPDGSSVDITPEFTYTGEGLPRTAEIEGFATNAAGAVYYVGEGSPAGTYENTTDEGAWNGGLFKQVSGHRWEFVTALDWSILGAVDGMDVDSSGNVYLNAQSEGIIRIAANGDTTVVASTTDEGDHFGSTRDLTVSNDGRTIYVGANNKVLRITSAGNVSVSALQDYSEFGNGVPANAWSGAVGVSLAPDGAVYFADPNFGGRVLKLGTNGVVSVHMRD